MLLIVQISFSHCLSFHDLIQMMTNTTLLKHRDTPERKSDTNEYI